MAEKKQIPLRINRELYDELSRWADDEFRSINGEIEYLLTECVKKRKKTKNPDAEEKEYGLFSSITVSEKSKE